MISYGERIKELRKQLQLSQNDLAERMGVKQSHVSHWENCTNPPLDQIQHICKALNMEVWEFFIPSELLESKLNISEEYYRHIRMVMNLDQEDQQGIMDLFNSQLEFIFYKRNIVSDE